MAETLDLAAFKLAVGPYTYPLQPEEGGSVRPSSVISDDVQAARILATVKALIEKEAPDAPETIADEAAIRAGAWLADILRPIASTSFSENRDAISIGGNAGAGLSRSASYRGGQCMRASGARALLGPWRKQSI